MENAMKTSELLAQAHLPQFEIGSDGYPLPGKVVKYYREQMTYVDREGREKHWTQADLARVLGLQETMVNLMEKHDKGLDSIERRRTLSTILRIPPVLLGLGSLDQIVEIVTGQEQNANKPIRTNITIYDIKKYQDTFKVYDFLFAEGLTYRNMAAIEHAIKRIRTDLACTSIESRRDLLKVLYDFELLCAKIYGSDFTNWRKTFEHIDNAVEIATLLDDRDLQAVSLYYSSEYHYRQGKLGLARVNIDGALLYSKGALPQTRAAIYAQDAMLRISDTSSSQILISEKMYEGSERLSVIKTDNKSLKFGKGSFFIYRAYALIEMNRPVKALEYLDDAERSINPSKKRLLLYLETERARCYIQKKKPEYEQATIVLKRAIATSRNIYVGQNIRRIEKLYLKLKGSSYGNSPDIVELGQEIQELKLIKIC